MSDREIKLGHNHFLHKCTDAPSDEYGNVGFYSDGGSVVEEWYVGAPYERVYGINYCPFCGDKLEDSKQ